MARASTTSTSKTRTNKAQIAKIAEETAKKTIKKETGRVARKEASRIAAKVATEAALNPDYELNDEDELELDSLVENEDDNEDEDEGSSLFKSIKSYSKSNFSRDDDDDDDSDDDNDADLSKSIKNRDIFAYANDLMNKGTPVRLQIKKNGQFLTTIKKPYSEEQLQQEFGEGHYAVILRNDVKGTFIKQQSFSIASPPVTKELEFQRYEKEKKDEKIDRMFETFSQMQSAQTESQQELFERLLEEQRRREDEEKERRREEREIMKQQEENNTNMLAAVLQAALTNKNHDGGGTTALLQMMQNQQNQTTQMIMESNKNFMMMIQEMRKDSQNMMEKIAQMNQEQAREFRTQLSEMSSNKSDGFDPVQMFQMLNDTRESGMNFGLKINELAKQIAETDIKPSEPKGIVQSVLDNLGKFAPLMAGGAQSQHTAQYFQQQQAGQLPQATQQVVRPQQAQTYAIQRPVSRPNPQQVTQSRPVIAKPSQIQKSAVKVSTPKPTQLTPTIQKTEKTENKASNVAVSKETAKITDGSRKDKVIGICIPLITHALQHSIDSKKLSEATLMAFKQHGITNTEAVKLVALEDLNNIAFKQYSLPDLPELRNYFKEYYEYLQKASTQEPRETTRSAN